MASARSGAEDAKEAESVLRLCFLGRWLPRAAYLFDDRIRLSKLDAGPASRAGGPGRRLRLQPEVGEDPLDHRLFQDCGEDLQLPVAAIRAMLHANDDDPFDQVGPADAARPTQRVLWLALSGDRGLGRHLRLFWPLR